VEGTAIREAGTAGSGFRVVATPDDAPPGLTPGAALHHPDYGSDGSIVFQASWNGGIWVISSEGAAPEPAGAFSGDSSPCMLADGRIASLWPGRPGNTGLYELKVMTPDGSSYVMLVTDTPIEDIGCGG
jgi:hypothetical protein